MSEFLLVVILGMVVARTSRLWRDDTITEGLRGWVEYHLDNAGRLEGARAWLAEMLGCPWCLSGWLSIFAVVVVDSATSRSVPVPSLSWLAVWWIANLCYWLVELVADRDALAWGERENKGLT